MKRIYIFAILVFIVLLAATPISASAQKSGESAQNNDTTAERINEILKSTLKRQEFVLDNNIHGYTFLPPLKEDVDEIRKVGSRAIPVLVQHLGSQNPRREQLLAIQFLAHIGTEEAVKALGDVVLNSSDSMSREYALKHLSIAPWNTIREYVQQAKNDPDPDVQKEALRIEAAHNERLK
jgi:hypothetical protein